MSRKDLLRNKMIVAIIKNKVFLVDLKPEHYVEIWRSITAARHCGFPAMERLANDLHIGVCVIYSKLILKIDWFNLAALVTILDDKKSEQYINSKSYRLLDEIIEILTCAVDMKLEIAK